MNANVPKAVREQLKRAEELRQQVVSDQQATPAPTQDAAPAETPAPAPETPAVQSTQEAPATTAAPAAEPAPQPAPTDDWEHKYRVLQGIHQADVQRARDLADQNRQLRDLISRMQDATAQAQQAPQAAPDQAASNKYAFVKPEEVEEYGADLMDVIARKAKEQYLPYIEQLQEHIKGLEQRLGAQVQQVGQVASMSAKDSFFAKLDSSVPYWENLNTNESFLSWLDSPDDLSGVNRREMFNRAYQNFDHVRVAKFFETFAAQTGMKQQAPAAETPPDNVLKPIVAAENLTTPSKASGAPAPVGKKIWTRQEIAAFYENARKGTYKGKEAERRRIEVDIFDAGREGRIQ